MQWVLCALIGYLIGNINPAFIISKLKGFDIRERGSGNAGASNAVITMGKRAGLFIHQQGHNRFTYRNTSFSADQLC